MRSWSSARFTIPLPPGHRFPIEKYAAVRDAVRAAGRLTVEEPDRLERWVLDLVHTRRYSSAILDCALSPAETRRLGLPAGPELRERSLRTAQGTVEAADDALTSGAGINLAGGTHHAFPDHGEGFCCFNDVALAVRRLQREGRVRRAAILDLDVHQGNGTAAIFAGDPDVFTFSMHGAGNFPFHKVASRLDVALPDGTGDAAYLAALDAHLDGVLDESGADLVFYLAGADPFAGDRFGRLSLTVDGLRRRDRMVFAACRRRGLPVVVMLAGGYAAVTDVVGIHLTTIAELERTHG